MREVRPERTGWRDEALSQRHRRWGWDCPAVDLDFLFLEYDRGEPSAIVEYKHENAPTQYASHPSYRALIVLGTRAEIPVFAVRYSDDFVTWRVVPLNDLARSFVPSRVELTEVEWITLLYRIRGHAVPPEVLDGAGVRI